MLLFFGEIVFEELTIILKEEDICGVTILQSEVYGLVCLVVFDVVDGHELLGLAPVPQGEGTVHVIGEDVFTVEGGFGNAVLKTSDPLLSTDANGLAREKVLLAVLEELNIVDGRGYEVDIYRLARPHVVLNDGVGDGDDVGGYRVGRDGEGGGLVALEGDALVLSHVEEGHLVMGAGQHDIGLEEVQVYDVGVLVGVVLGLKLEALFVLAVFVLQEEAVGVATVEEVVKGLDFVEAGDVAVAEGFGVGVLQRFSQLDSRLLLNHLYK